MGPNKFFAKTYDALVVISSKRTPMTRQLYVFASENYDKNFVYDLKETQWLYFSNIYCCILGNVHEYMGKEYNIHH
jgi:hypothetical protein